MLRYDQLPNVTQAWEEYGAKCKANASLRANEYAAALSLPVVEQDAAFSAARRRWESAHDESWRKYQMEWARVAVSTAVQVVGERDARIDDTPVSGAAPDVGPFFRDVPWRSVGSV
jgi:hypothetical protein